MSSAVAQTKSQCAPGGPQSTPAQPNNPSQYPPNECGLQLGKSQAAPGEPVSVSGDGYKPNSSVSIEFRSAPVVVGSATTNAQGSFSTTITIPSTASAGQHTIAAVGVNANGTAREETAAITISAPASADRARADAAGSTLPRTGTAIALYTIIGLALIAVGVFAVMAVRRRSKTTVTAA